MYHVMSFINHYNSRTSNYAYLQIRLSTFPGMKMLVLDSFCVLNSAANEILIQKEVLQQTKKLVQDFLFISTGKISFSNKWTFIHS